MIVSQTRSNALCAKPPNHRFSGLAQKENEMKKLFVEIKTNSNITYSADDIECALDEFFKTRGRFSVNEATQPPLNGDLAVCVLCGSNVLLQCQKCGSVVTSTAKHVS